VSSTWPRRYHGRQRPRRTRSAPRFGYDRRVVNLSRLVVVALGAFAAAQPVVADPAPVGAPIGGPVGSSEAAARALLDRWLAAQNQGRYDDYAALYAPGFAGVKRVGKTVKAMNRAAWLKDRKAMFKAKLEVSARDVVIAPPAAGAATGVTLTFTQTWRSGRYGDVGPKRIVLDPTNRSILSEELLTSRPLLTETACLQALHPGASLARKRTAADDGARAITGVAVTDLGGRWACQVDVLDSGTVEVAIGILRFGKRWDLAGRLDLTYDHAPAAAEGDESTGGQVAVAPIALHASVPTIVVTRELRADGPQYAKREVTTTIYRVDGSDLVELLSWDDGGSTGEADDVTRCELEVGAKRTAGWPALTLRCTATTVQWAAGDTEPTETTTATRYRWDGARYSE
jgi:hypothetical protein